ncbi:MAG: hypothetical protein JRJ84_25135 [Deltaproteobacteria bacterium]|nr:hypothetical protein [Deltaproteobacteria bacterium]
MHTKHHASIFALAAALLLGGCGDKLIVIDEAAADYRLDEIDASLPLCGAMDVGTPTRAMRSAVGQMQQFARYTRLLSGSKGRMPPMLPMAGVGSTGTCGGSLDVTFDHGGGDTDYVLAFNSYCMTSSDGDIVINGVVEAFEDGKPSPMGPVVDSLEMETDGEVEIVHNGETILATIRGDRTEYGIPAAGGPGIPDAENPNVRTLREASAVFVDHDNREDYIRDVRIERTGGTSATVTILEGEAGTKGVGRVDIRTAAGDPLVINVGGSRVVSGTVELLGADDTIMTLQPSCTQPGVIDITVNGAPYDQAADCSTALGPAAEAVVAMYNALPLY